MNHGAEGVVVNGVVDVFAFLGKAAASAFFEAMEVFAAKVPATWSLAEIAAEGGEVADLWGGDGLCGLDEGGRKFFEKGVLYGLGECEHRADG